MYRIRDLDVRILLRYMGEEQKIEGDGRVGRNLKAGQSALLEIIFPSGLPVWPIRVDGRKNVIMARVEEATTHTMIRIWEASSGYAYTKYPDNHIRLLRRSSPEKLEHWEIALVSQNGVFWVTVQKTYDILVGQKGGEFACPKFEERWPQMVNFLKERLAGEDLPSLETDAVDAAGTLADTSDLGENEGVVLWWNSAQQMGAIATKQGAVRVHWSQITTGHQNRRFLVAGQKVVFECLRQIKSAGKRPTRFEFEAMIVRPVEH